MTRDELQVLRESEKNDDQIVEILFTKLNEAERKVTSLQQSIEYWKRSFNKEVEAKRQKE